MLRKLLADGKRDVVLTYTYSQAMYADMQEGRVPPSIADFEKLADHYRLSSVWMGLHAWNEVCKGRMSWEEWLPDGLHPTHRGSLSYGQSVIAFLERELEGAHASLGDEPQQPLLPEAYHPANWASAYALDFAQVELEGPWTIRRWPHLVWMDRVLHTSAPGAKLAFSFQGRGLLLGFDFGKASAEFRYRLDGGAWEVSERERPEWCGDHGWYRVSPIADDLPPGEHRFELEVVHGNKPDCRGTHLALALIGVIE
ncbi:hypothetical protein N6H14_21100 [Paenibacillus sp. CC-CFT747]|nr:hypothetical protein N6H14_21100 [Paenibacillus sp. CC-CFT747]